MDVPHYAELSIKSLYDDAMKDDTLKMYLPSRNQLSNKLPEREFFFGLGVLSEGIGSKTLSGQLMKSAIRLRRKRRKKITLL